jgi:hypothetical protein
LKLLISIVIKTHLHLHLKNLGASFTLQTYRIGIEGSVEKTFRTIDLSKASKDNLSEKIIELILNGREHVILYFHACSASSAHDIISHGIKLHMDADFRNFSHRNGFYLSDSLQKVLVFGAEKFRSNNRMSILVFEFEEDPRARHPGLDLSDSAHKERLRKVVSYFRNGAANPSPNLAAHGLEFDFDQKYQFIYGPYCDFNRQRGASAPENVQIYSDLNQVCFSS